MTHQQQKKFVKDLAKNVLDDLLADATKWSNEWDGYELRRLLADAFALVVIEKSSKISERRAKAAYKKYCFFNELYLS